MAKGKEKTLAPAKAGRISKPGRPAARAAPHAPEGKAPPPESNAHHQGSLSPEQVYRMIQETAYFKAKARGFEPGGEVQDWIEAEAEVRRRLDSRV